MYKKEVIIIHEMGLHARPASIFIKEASKFKSEIILIKDEKEYNAKSIIKILSMGAVKGDLITIKAEGSDDQLAVNTLVNIINSNFE